MVKARLKTAEQIGPDWLCCGQLIRYFDIDGGTELDLSNTVRWLTVRCNYCHSILTIAYRRILGRSLRGSNLVPMMFVDLDEGKDGAR